MDGLIELTTRFVVLEGDNIDTDRIIPARFLTSTSRDGIGKGLFADWRRDEAGNPRPDFALHRPEAEGAEALVVGRNFGCGSSREHAAWALRDNGFRVIIGTELADIFRANALKNGLLCVQVSEPVHERLVRQGSGSIEVSVERRVLRLEDGFETVFPLDPFARHCLMEGIDDLGYLLQQGETIAAFERRRESAGVGPGERVPRTNRVELEESAGVGHESRALRRDGAEVPGVGGHPPRGRT